MPPILHIEETRSTNSYIKELLSNEELEEGTIVTTTHQTAGRGQKGNGWEAQKGMNLTFSIIIYPRFVSINKQFILSQAISLAIIDTLNNYVSGFSIKWPNDIYWQKKKIAGILIENTLSENGIASSIIGVGININQEKFLSDAPNPISLKNITETNHNLEEILASIQQQFLSYYQDMKKVQQTDIIEKYRENLFRKEGFHLYHDGEKEFEAKLKNIAPDGHLFLETKEGKEVKFAFKEIRYIL